MCCGIKDYLLILYTYSIMPKEMTTFARWNKQEIKTIKTR